MKKYITILMLLVLLMIPVLTIVTTNIYLPQSTPQNNCPFPDDCDQGPWW